MGGRSENCIADGINDIVPVVGSAAEEQRTAEIFDFYNLFGVFDRIKVNRFRAKSFLR